MEAKRHQDLLEGLSRVRKAKFATDVPLGIFLGVVVVFFALQWLGCESWFKPIYQLFFVLLFLGFAMLFIQENIKCPNCGRKFNVKINGAYYFRSLFSRKCMNCGLRLNGDNVSEYANDL